MAKPLILTDVRGCREVGRDGIEAILVPARNPHALAAAIERVVHDVDLRRGLGAAARARATAIFDERRVHGTLIAGYREVLSRKGRPEVGGEVTLREARRDDATSLARLHRAVFPGGVLPSLGERFLARLYRAFATDAGTVAVVAADGPKVIGLAIAVVSSRRFSLRFALRHGAAAAVAAAPSLLEPAVLRRALETARMSVGDTLPGARLIALAVDPARQREGIGRRLVADVVDRLAARGAPEVALVTEVRNDGANAFYETLGFRRGGEISVHDDVPSNVWVARCPS